MSALDNKALWKRWQELWNGDLAIADEIIAPDFVARFATVGNGPSEVRGPEGLKQWIGGSLANFTDYGFTSAIDPLADRNMVVGQWIFRAVYQGGIPGAHPAAIGERVEYAGIDIFRVESGRIVEYFLCADILQMLLEQAGAIPEQVPVPTKP